MLYRSGLEPYLCDDNSNSDNTECYDIVGDISQEDISGSSDSSGNTTAEDKVENSELRPLKPPKFQKGVLRTNCIDCLDRTNVAQYAYGLAALGHQLHALGAIESPELGLEAPLAHHLMHFYERMGDTLAVQYSGSAAHNKVICGISLVVMAGRGYNIWFGVFKIGQFISLSCIIRRDHTKMLALFFILPYILFQHILEPVMDEFACFDTILYRKLSYYLL